MKEKEFFKENCKHDFELIEVINSEKELFKCLYCGCEKIEYYSYIDERGECL